MNWNSQHRENFFLSGAIKKKRVFLSYKQLLQFFIGWQDVQSGLSLSVPLIGFGNNGVIAPIASVEVHWREAVQCSH